jgi:D-tyrosyl-tRNA(Tyr) deacylase
VRAVVQRVLRVEIRVAGTTVGEIGRGLLALVAVGKEDDPQSARALATKLTRTGFLRTPKVE